MKSKNNFSDQICLESGIADIVLSFSNIDVDGNGEISIQEILKALKTTNPNASNDQIQEFKTVLENIVPLYSKEKNNFWTLSEFKTFMAECEVLEKMQQE